ncbi:hypothetical protein [Sphingomonas sp. M1-B02]|uniref:hypothetical protein n=1 Tax=Sphingomonas sp. M1-B02 TaxID=3114300 RepID=UPI00223EB7FD|nr:hypothetical protein [Sphingomonas sp. S6-11]UZK67808.1 hypothetical protein OKW87_08280 [Sphingomonas sp. S6-11]
MSIEHDFRLRAARAIYEACYPTEDCFPVEFDEAEHFRMIHYRQVVGAAQQARALLAEQFSHLALSKEWATA